MVLAVLVPTWSHGVDVVVDVVDVHAVTEVFFLTGLEHFAHMYWLLLKTFRRILGIAHNGESADKLELIGLTLGLTLSKGASLAQSAGPKGDAPALHLSL